MTTQRSGGRAKQTVSTSSFRHILWNTTFSWSNISHLISIRTT